MGCLAAFIGANPQLQLSVSDPVNTIILTGRAGRDPEIKYFETGNVVANLSLAVNRPVKDEDCDWFNLEIWGKQAQIAADYVRKGSLIGVVGSIRIEKWTDRTSGQEKYKPVVRVDRLELLGSKRDAEQATDTAPAPAPAQRPAATAPATRQAPAPTPTPISDEEIPF